MNYKRKQFINLIESVSKGEIKPIVVAHKDRLCRLGFEFVEWFCHLNDCYIVVINSKTETVQKILLKRIASFLASMGLTIEDAVTRGWLHSKHLNSKKARKAAT